MQLLTDLDVSPRGFQIPKTDKLDAGGGRILQYGLEAIGIQSHSQLKSKILKHPQGEVTGGVVCRLFHLCFWQCHHCLANSPFVLLLLFQFQ